MKSSPSSRPACLPRTPLATKTDASKLFRNIDPYFRQTLDKLYLRQLSASEWQRQQLVEAEDAVVKAEGAAAAGSDAAPAAAPAPAKTPGAGANGSRPTSGGLQR